MSKGKEPDGRFEAVSTNEVPPNFGYCIPTVGSLLGVWLLISLSIPIANAQDDPEASTEKQVLEEVTVTGSRIIRDGSRAPSPMTVMGNDYLENRGSFNIADALNELPAFRGSTTPAFTANKTLNPGANYLNLRNLGVNRTLVLIDGNRHVPSSDLGQIDLNMIPTVMLERAEVVTGGASAVYGSDAVAGVANLILKKRVEGLELRMTYGETDRGDNEEFRFSGLGGTTFGSGRGYITLAVEYSDADGIGDPYTRDWGRREYGLVTNPTPGSTPIRIISSNVRPATMAPGGLITSGPLRGIKFLDDGTPAMFEYGDLAGGQSMIGGEGYGNTLMRGVGLMPELERRTAYLRLGYELNDSTAMFLDLSGGWTEGVSTTPYYFNFGNLTIQRGNPFLPASIATQMDSAGISSFRFGRFWTDIGNANSIATTELRRIVTGLEGTLASEWTWDASVQYGESDYLQEVVNSFIPTRINQAIDSVSTPDGIACRVALTDPSTACQPFNPFGVGQNAPGTKDYLVATQIFDQTQKETSANVGMAGQLFDVGAGELGVAFGVEYRKQRLNAVADPLSEERQFAFGNPRSLRGEFDVTEAYVEVEAPILAGLPAIDSLTFNGAYRYADYSTSGGVDMWKVGAVWGLSEDLRLRTTRSRDVRAPNIPELFTPERNNGAFVIVDPFNGNATSIAFNILRGNTELDPELADTFTFGIVYQPSWLSGLQMSADYYDIDISDAIASLPPQETVNRCFAGETVLCSLIVRDSSGAISFVESQAVNIATARNRGMDFELGYATSLPRGNLDLRLFATKTIKSERTNGPTIIRYDGQNNQDLGIPSWTANGLATYSLDQWSVTAQGRYTSSGNFSNAFVEGIDINDNSLPSVFYLNLSGQYEFNLAQHSSKLRLRVFGSVDNVLDKDPPPVPGTIVATNTNFYDVIGRRYRIGVIVNF